MRLQNITIKDYLEKNSVPFQEDATHLIIACQFCEKTDGAGNQQAIFYINKTNGDGQCYECQVITDFVETIKKFGIEDKITGVENGVIRFANSDTDKQHKKQFAEQPAEPEKPELPVDTSQFKPLTTAELTQTLGLTIKKDEQNKLITFLCELSAYTEDAQFNVSFNAPSASGKSYIPTEIARLFPERDVMEIAYCSPTSFFHEVGVWDKERKVQIVDLSRKILIFLDQPHNDLLARLRPLLSHDKKEITLKITDKNQKQGLRTKNVLLRGFPAVIFCTAGLRIDEQEATRFLLLSPEINQEKLRNGISEAIKRAADSKEYKKWLEEVPERKMLKERIWGIKQAAVKDVKLSPTIQKKIEEKFIGKKLKPKHQRDVKRLISLVKSFSLLNLWWRNYDGETIVADDVDFAEAEKIWNGISECQELNLPPYIYSLYTEVVIPLWEERRVASVDEGITRQDVLKRHYSVYGRPLNDFQLRQQILPMLEVAGLIIQEEDGKDKRRKLIYPGNNPDGSVGENNQQNQ